MINYKLENISSCDVCPIKVNGDYYAWCEDANNMLVCQCKYPYAFNAEETKCVHMFQGNIFIYIFHYVVLIPAHFYLIVSCTRLYLHKIHVLVKRKQPITCVEKLTIYVKGNVVISGLLFALFFLICKGIREVLFVWCPPRLYNLMDATFYCICACGTLLMYNFSVMTSKTRDNKMRNLLSNLSLCFSALSMLLLFIGTFVENWPKLIHTIFLTYMRAMYGFGLVVGIVYFGRKITYQVTQYNSSRQNNNNRGKLSCSGLKEMKKNAILTVMNYYLKVLSAYIITVIFLTILDNRSMYNDTWNKYTTAKQLVYIIIWRISDYLLLISILRIFEGTTQSKLFPWLHICSNPVVKKMENANDTVVSDVSSYNPGETSQVDIHLYSEQTTPTVARNDTLVHTQR